MSSERQQPSLAETGFADQLSTLEKRDWELWSIVLILLTVFAGGVICFAYGSWRESQALSPTLIRFLWPLLFGLVSLVLLLNIYLIDKKRTLAHLRRRMLQQELRLQQHRTEAITDALTGVYNRRFLEEILPKEARRATRTGRALSILLADVDDFRKINAQLGHLVGDAVLAGVAHTLKRSLRTSDYIFRFGGDEFLIALPETDEAGAATAAQRLKQTLAGHKELQTRVGRPVTLAMGRAIWRAGRSLDAVIEEAEARLNAARAAKTSSEPSASN